MTTVMKMNRMVKAKTNGSNFQRKATVIIMELIDYINIGILLSTLTQTHLHTHLHTYILLILFRVFTLELYTIECFVFVFVLKKIK